MKINQKIFIIVLFLSLMVYSCGTYTGNIESSSIYRESSFIKEQLNSINKDSAIDTTIYITAFPHKHIIIDGESYTTFNLGFPIYYQGREATTIDLGSGKTDNSPTLPASLSIHKTKSKFLLKSKVPIYKEWNFLFLGKSPYLYFFPAKLTLDYLKVDKNLLRIVSLAKNPDSIAIGTKNLFSNIILPDIQQNEANKDTSLITNSEELEKGLQSSRPLLSSVLSPPILPPHLIALNSSSIFIAQEKYNLGPLGTSIPQHLPLTCDFQSTLKLYNNIFSGKLSNDLQLNNAELKKLISWLRAYPLTKNANSLIDGSLTPSFIAFDKKGLVQKKRDYKAVQLLKEATRIDSLWIEPKNNLTKVLEKLKDESNYANKYYSMGKRFKAGINASIFSINNIDKPNYFKVDSEYTFFVPITIGPSISYQITQNICGSFNWDVWNTRNYSKHFSNFVKDRGSLNLYYQSPIRVQLKNKGKRLQLMIGYARLSEIVDYDSNLFYGNGEAFEFGIGLVSRKGYYYSEPKVELTMDLTINLIYRTGYFGNFTSTNNGQKILLVSEANGQPMTINPNGLFLNLNLSLFTF